MILFHSTNLNTPHEERTYSILFKTSRKMSLVFIRWGSLSGVTDMSSQWACRCKKNTGRYKGGKGKGGIKDFFLTDEKETHISRWNEIFFFNWKLKSLKWQGNINDSQINTLGHQMLFNSQLARAESTIYTFKPSGSLCNLLLSKVVNISFYKRTCW